MDPQAPALCSLALRTEVAVSLYGSVLSRSSGADYWVVRSPDNPSYWYGNCLVFDSPPAEGDFPQWMAAFEREIGPAAEHRVFRIDAGDGDAGVAEAFLSQGFSVQRTDVLTAAEVVPPSKLHDGLVVRPLETDREWEEALALGVRIGIDDDGLADTPGHLEFQRGRLATYRTMQARGLGHTWGAFFGGSLVARLGLFHVDDLSRFQAVMTHPEHRRQGICGTLVYTVSQRALAALPGRSLVMCAVEDYHATRIYQSIGFRPTESCVDFLRKPADV